MVVWSCLGDHPATCDGRHVTLFHCILTDHCSNSANKLVSHTIFTQQDCRLWTWWDIEWINHYLHLAENEAACSRPLIVPVNTTMWASQPASLCCCCCCCCSSLPCWLTATLCVCLSVCAAAATAGSLLQTSNHANMDTATILTSNLCIQRPQHQAFPLQFSAFN